MLNWKEVLDWKFPDVEQSYTARDSMLYALGLGYGRDAMDEDDLRYVFEEHAQGLLAVPSMAVVLGGVVMYLGPAFLPLLPAAILYINLASDGLPALALGIAPPDKDIMQLVGDGVSMIDALHQKTYTREEVNKKMGVPPEKIPDFLALVGDTSDNIPGIRGVGDKTAATLLEQYGTLENLIAQNPVVPRIQTKQPFSDPEQLERILISRKLVELRRNVPLPIALEDLVVTEWNLPELHQLFTELEFQVLVEKVKMKMPP